MSLAKRFNSALHLCVALAALAFSAADDRPLLAGLAAVAVGVSWLLSARRVDRPPALPRIGINTLVIAAILNAALRAVGAQLGESVVSTLGQFLVFIILIKLLDRRGPRDDAQLITLSIFVSIAAMLTGAQLVVGVLLIVFIPAAVATAMLWQLRAGEILLVNAEEEAGGRAALGGARAGLVGPPGHRARGGFVLVCAISVGASCAIATTVFVVVPRVGGEFLGRFGVTRQPVIGFRESVTLGQAGLLSEDPTPVLDLMVSDVRGDNIGSAVVTQYIRGAARDLYDPKERTWRDSSQELPPFPESRSRRWQAHQLNARSTAHEAGMGEAWVLPWSKPPEDDEADRPMARAIVQKITMRADANNLFSLWRPATVTPDRSVHLAFSETTGTIRRSESWGQRFTYTVHSAVGDEVYPRPSWATSAEPILGFQQGPIRDLASRVVGNARTGRLAAIAIRDYLQKNCEYTTEMVAPPEEQDAIEFFLFDRKKGHCEYFASAMAAMCQSQGIPARVVTGYVAAEFNSLTGQYTVRQSNAHAWVEAFIFSDAATGRGRWERFDPSPPAEIDRIHHPHRSLLAQARSWYEALEFGWTSSFVAFDNVSGPRHGGMFTEAEATPRVALFADRVVAQLRTWLADPGKVPWWLKWSPLLCGAGAIFGVLLQRGLKHWQPTGRTVRARELGYVPERPTGVYAKTLRALALAGVPKPEWMPPEQFAQHLATRAPKAADLLRTLARHHYVQRFGGRAPSAAEASSAQAAVRELAQALRSERPAR